MTLQKVKDRDEFGVTFANPALPSDTTRVKQQTQTKVVQGISLDNSKLESVALRGAALNDKGAKETVSCRIILSGSIQNKAIAKKLAKDHCLQFIKWLDEDAFEGFDPQSAPDYGQA